ncbi:MAG: hypothetical protein LBM21_00580, partial [Coriobacteriales bacterium]|nr:hypothetical protein [Coriobacteriales bacterium]
MQLGLTIPLQRFLKASKPPYGDPIDPFFCWDIHKVPSLSPSTLIAVNASNRYALVFMGMTAGRWKRIPDIVTDGIAEALQLDGYTSLQAETYIAAAGTPEFTKTHGRRSVAGLNRAIDTLYVEAKRFDDRQLFQPQVSKALNVELCHAAAFASSGLGYPREFFRSEERRVG